MPIWLFIFGNKNGCELNSSVFLLSDSIMETETTNFCSIIQKLQEPRAIYEYIVLAQIKIKISYKCS